MWLGRCFLEKKKFRVMLLMQFQASVGMCLQDSKTETGLGTFCTLRWKRSQESKIGEDKGLQAGRVDTGHGGHLLSLFLLQVGKLRPRSEDKMSSMACGELEAESGWLPRTPDCPPGLFPLCYMVSWVERRHRKDVKCKMEK